MAALPNPGCVLCDTAFCGLDVCTRSLVLRVLLRCSTTETTQWLLLRTHGDDVFELSREETQSMYARAVLEGRPEYAADQEDPNHIPPLRDFVHRRNPPKGSWNQVRIHNWGHSKLDFMLGDFYAVTEDHPTEIILTHAEKVRPRCCCAVPSLHGCA